MPKTKIAVWNERGLEMMDFSIREGLARHKKDWCEKVGFPYTNLPQIRSGLQSFTHVVLLNAATLINADMNWVYGLESAMFRTTRHRNALELLKEGVAMLESDLRTKSRKKTRS